MKIKTHADLQKAVTKRQMKMAKAFEKAAVLYSTKGGEITGINAKDLYHSSRLEEVQVDARSVAVECSICLEDFFKENYPAPVDEIRSAFFRNDLGQEANSIILDGDRLKMRFESLCAKEVIEQIREFLEDLEDRHEWAVDQVLEKNPVFGINRL